MRIVVFGASGGVGQQIVEQALAQGHDVTSAIRSTNIAKDNAQDRIVACDVTDARAVERVIQGQDAVLCALGTHAKGPVSLYSTGARNIIAGMEAQGVRRLLFLSNFGVLNEAGMGLSQSLLLYLVKRVLRHTLADHRAALATMRCSTIIWTAVRALALNDGPRTGRYRVAVDGLPARGIRISRADVAHFMIEEAQRSAFANCAPAIAY